MWIVAVLVLGTFGYALWRRRQEREQVLAPHRRRESIRQLIKGQRKPATVYNGNSIRVVEEDVPFLGLRHRYQMGKLFEAAARSSTGSIQIGLQEIVRPHSQEHGLAAGADADKLRAQILREYGIDLETLEDHG